MLNFSRNDRHSDVKEIGKPGLKPTPYGSSPLQSAPAASQTAPRPPAATNAPNPSPAQTPAPAPAAESAPSPSATSGGSGSKLIVGANIKVKGVEISNCDVLVIEGQVEATVNSKAMEISGPGTLNGTAHIDVAEIHGEFSGELTARSKLVVHGTGRVTGTIRYGKLVVAEGGTLTGDLRQIDAAPGERAERVVEPPAAAPMQDMRPLLNPQR